MALVAIPLSSAMTRELAFRWKFAGLPVAQADSSLNALGVLELSLTVHMGRVALMAGTGTA